MWQWDLALAEAFGGEGLKLRAGDEKVTMGKESIPVRGNRTKVIQKEDEVWLELRGEEKGVLGSP